MLIDQLCDRLDLVAIIILGISHQGRVLVGGSAKGDHTGFNVSKKEFRRILHEALDVAINKMTK